MEQKPEAAKPEAEKPEAPKAEAPKKREDGLDQAKIDQYSKRWDEIIKRKKGEKNDVAYTDLDTAVDLLREYYKGHKTLGSGYFGSFMARLERTITLHAGRNHIKPAQDIVIKAEEKETKITNVEQLLTELKAAIVADKRNIKPDGKFAHYLYVIQQKAKAEVINVIAVNEEIDKASKEKATEAVKPAEAPKADAAKADAAKAEAPKPAAETQKSASSYWGSFTYALSYVNPLAYVKSTEKEPVFEQADRKFGC